jgi:hypothetical protein
MGFAAPYVLFSSLQAPALGTVGAHVEGYRRLLEAIRDDRFDFQAAAGMELLDHGNLPLREGD